MLRYKKDQARTKELVPFAKAAEEKTPMRRSRGFRLAAIAHISLLAAMMVWIVPGAPAQDRRGRPAEAKNMELVGMSDLQGRPAYQPVIHLQGNRWVA